MLLPRRLPAAVGLEPSNNATETADHPPSKLARPKNNKNDEDEQEDKNEEAVVESTATTTAAATSGTTSTPTPAVEQGAPPSEADISPHHGLASATKLPKQPPLLTPLLLTRDHDHPQGEPTESSEFAATQAETLRLQEDTSTATRALQEMAIISTTTSSSSQHYSEAGFVLTPGPVPYHPHQQQRPLPPSEADSISHVLASATDLPPLLLTSDNDHSQDEPAESSEFAAAAQAETLRLPEN